MWLVKTRWPCQCQGRERARALHARRVRGEEAARTAPPVIVVLCHGCARWSQAQLLNEIFRGDWGVNPARPLRPDGWRIQFNSQIGVLAGPLVQPANHEAHAADPETIWPPEARHWVQPA